MRGVMTRGAITDLAGRPYEWKVLPYDNNAPEVTTYPSTAEVHDQRDNFGQLTQKSVIGGISIVDNVVSYAMAGVPEEVVLGNGVTRVDTYDERRRLLARLYTKGSRELAGLEYSYDSADRERRRTYRHLARTDAWSYDEDNRLKTATFGHDPTTIPQYVYRREIGYATDKSDTIVEIQTVGTGAITPPLFVSQQHFLTAQGLYFGLANAITVGAQQYDQTRDDLGNVTQTFLEPGLAKLSYDGLSQLRKVLFDQDTAPADDDLSIEYKYRADGALLERKLVCGAAVGCVPETRTYVYAGLLLLEERDTTTQALLARYYYEDGTDIPIAAEIRNDTGTLQPVYYVTDRVGSVIGLLDQNGEWIEQVTYDVYGGRPTYLSADVLPPEISKVQLEPNGELLVAFTEPVHAITPLVAALSLTSGSVSLPGTWAAPPALAGFAPGTVFSFTPSSPLSATVTLELHAGSVADALGNEGANASLQLTVAPGVLHSGPPQGSTAGATLPRSSVGNNLGFQAHLYDADAGLLLARARVINPITGSFLQKDPNGFEDSVNLYAFARHDPINNRDPTGKETAEEMVARIAREAKNPRPHVEPDEAITALAIAGVVTTLCPMCGIENDEQADITPVVAAGGVVVVAKGVKAAAAARARPPGGGGAASGGGAGQGSAPPGPPGTRPVPPELADRIVGGGGPPHRGRFQAQGGGTEKSVAWAQDTPPTAGQAQTMIDQLERQLTKAEKKVRANALRDARKFVDRCAASGGVCAPVSKSFPGEGKGVRVDVEVRTGTAFTPD